MTEKTMTVPETPACVRLVIDAETYGRLPDAPELMRAGEELDDMAATHELPEVRELAESLLTMLGAGLPTERERTMTNYTTTTDARIALDNSGVNEYVTDEQAREAVIARMFRRSESPEQAVAEVLNLDDADRRALGLE